MNTDTQMTSEALEEFGKMHATIYELEEIRTILKDLMTKLLKAKNG
jgi:hypothetical protein